MWLRVHSQVSTPLTGHPHFDRRTRRLAGDVHQPRLGLNVDIVPWVLRVWSRLTVALMRHAQCQLGCSHCPHQSFAAHP